MPLVLKPFAAPKEEQPAIDSLEEWLSGEKPKLIGPNNEERDLPDSLYNVLLEAISLMSEGKTISIVTFEEVLSTEQAAKFLNVSRPFLSKLLDEDRIPYISVGSHRRINITDLVSYKNQRDAKRKQVLRELVEISREENLYSKNMEAIE